jgi:hypothetical protein
VRVEARQVEVAHRQLGAALQIFTDNLDPASVHVLVACGMELAHALMERGGQEPFQAIAVAENPTLSVRTYREIRTQYWNAFKHFRDRKGQEREDAELLAELGRARTRPKAIVEPLMRAEVSHLR